MRNIIVVEAYSTGVNYIADIVNRGFSPVVLEVGLEEDSPLFESRREGYKQIRDKYELIREQENYEATLALVRSYDPVVIVPGSERGVILANRLAADLSLPGNPVDILPQMTRKDAMQEALGKAGVRAIRGRVVTSAEEALAFCAENRFEEAVVKPTESAGSVGLFLCSDREEVKSAVDELLAMKDIYGREITEVLVQEQIHGTEYVVNAAVCGGIPRLTSIFRYKKIRTAEGGYIYDNAETIGELEPGHTALVEYAYDTVRAIGIQYGAVHGEYMVDEKGPVLIEVNCRPIGASMPAEFLNRIFGQHETDSVLDSYLSPKRFFREMEKPYRTFSQGYLKFIKVPKDMSSKSLPIWVIAENLSSTYKISLPDRHANRFFIKTRDVESAGGVIYMVNPDKAAADRDIKLLTDIEDMYFEYIFNDGLSRRLIPMKNACELNVDAYAETAGSVLVVSETGRQYPRGMVINAAQADLVNDDFDLLVIDLGQYIISSDEISILELMFKLMRKVKPGGMVIIGEETYQFMTYKRAGAELILRILGYEIAAPAYNERGMVKGIRRH